MRFLIFLSFLSFFSLLFCEDGKIVSSFSLSNSCEDTITDDYVVDFEDDVSVSWIESFSQRLQLKLKWLNAAREERLVIFEDVLDSQALIRELQASNELENVEPDALYFLVQSDLPEPKPSDFKDPFYKYQWHMEMIGLSSALRMRQGDGAVVAVIDTGVAYEDHEKFKRARDLNQTRFVSPWNFITKTSHANDDHGHGTHVAGTIAQSTNNGLGVVGIAPGATIMPLKVLDASGRGSLSAIADAIYYASDHGAHIINMSLGGPFPSKILKKACRYAMDRGVLLVCAAGNSSKSVGYPAAYPECMAVSSVQIDSNLAFYSSRGKEIEIAAPGGNVQQDLNRDGYPDGVLQNTIYSKEPGKDDYMLFMGTSMAAPHVAGVAALLVSAGVTRGDLIRRIIKESAIKKEPQIHFGSGLLRADRALASVMGTWPIYRILMGILLFVVFVKLSLWTKILHPAFLFGFFATASGFCVFPYSEHLPSILQFPFSQWDQIFFGPSQGSPLFRSALLVLVLTGFLFSFKSLRAFSMGICFGLSGWLFVEFITPFTDLAWVPVSFGFESLWYLVNSIFCAFAGKCHFRVEE